MEKIISLSFSGFCLLLSMGCFNDFLSDSKKANDVKFMTNAAQENACGQTDGSTGYVRFKMDGQDISIMNCKAEHFPAGYMCPTCVEFFEVTGSCNEVMATIYIGDGTVGDHNTSSQLTHEWILVSVAWAGGAGVVGMGPKDGTSTIKVTLHDNTSIKGTFSGSVCDSAGQCRNVTEGEFFSVGLQSY